MKIALYSGIALLVLFELANVYFIMPMPFSQSWDSIGIAYALHSWRWPLRALAAALIVAGVSKRTTWGWQKWLAGASLVAAAAVVYAANFVLAADAMFLAPTSVVMEPAARSAVPVAGLVVGVTLNGEARAYPVQYIGYHHQVSDTIGGQPIMVTFCTVCRTGRVFSPVIDGKVETFRLVGMDRFNAMFEDASTGSWWRQATGEAIAGPRTGTLLSGIHSEQMTLSQWLDLHPSSLIMQPDHELRDQYPENLDYETGKSQSTLTGTDASSWGEKSWLIGITLNGKARAYDWNRLRRERVINDELGGQPLVLALADDAASFVAFERPNARVKFSLSGNRLIADGESYDLSGRGDSGSGSLKPLFASQEFWHSWRTFHPATDIY